MLIFPFLFFLSPIKSVCSRYGAGAVGGDRGDVSPASGQPALPSLRSPSPAGMPHMWAEPSGDPASAGGLD